MARLPSPPCFMLAAMSVALIACGGEREEPFNPSEPEEIREPVNSFLVFDGLSEDINGFPFTDTGGKRLEVMDNVEDYQTLLDAYTDQFVSEPDFEAGQVLLYDGGWIDDSVCEQQLDLRRVEAHAITDNEEVVQVTLSYQRNDADDDEECPDELLFRPFEFHYIESRADIVIVEEVEGVSGG